MSFEVRHSDSTPAPQEVMKGRKDSERSIDGEYLRSLETMAHMSLEEIKQVKNQEVDAIEMEMRKINGFIQPKNKALESSDEWPDNRVPFQASSEELVERVGKPYRVAYVRKDFIAPKFGIAYGNNKDCIVRNDLPGLVKNFVTEHELYHLRDPHTWGGWIGREIRANIVPGVKDPVGLAATILYSLNPERLRLYWKRFKEGF